MTSDEPTNIMEVIQKWLTQRKPFSVPIAANHTLLPLKSRNFMRLRGSPTNPSVAPIAVVLGKQNGMVAVAEATATEVPARCIPLLADNAASRLKFPFSLAATSLFFAEIATPRADSRD
jgi:hypothetical protein